MAKRTRLFKRRRQSAGGRRSRGGRRSKVTANNAGSTSTSPSPFHSESAASGMANTGSSASMMKPEFEYWGSEPMQNMIHRSFMREFQPIAALAIGAPIDFVIHPAPHLYIVPFKSLIRLKVRIENTDTNALIVDANRVGPVNC